MRDDADKKNQPDDPFQMLQNRGGPGVTTPIHQVCYIRDISFEDLADAEPGVLIPFPYSWDDVDRGNRTERGDPWALIHETDNYLLFQIR